MITYDIEHFDTLAEDIKTLLPLHHDEVEDYDGVLDVDFDFYKQADDLGMLTPFTIRDGGRLIGYAIYIVRKSPHYRTETWAVNDIIWLHPDYRRFGVGNTFFNFIEAQLTPCTMHTTVKLGHPELAMLLHSRGHKLSESSYLKRLV